MTSDEIKTLRNDPDGLLSYEYLANHMGQSSPDEIDAVIENMIAVDMSGQFLASAARSLHAIDPAGFAEPVRRLVAATIDKDREHRYLPDLLTGLYGEDCVADARRLSASDDNFRRIYKRLYPASDSF